MRTIAIILLLAVLYRHSAHNWLPKNFSPAAWFYINSGLFEALLCGVFLVVALECRRTVWTKVLALAMVIGVIEGLQMSVCRLGTKIIQPGNLCDNMVGLPVGATFFSLYFIALCFIFGIHYAKPAR
jgi:hypothetical protein